jgi:hypothetical protein
MSKVSWGKAWESFENTEGLTRIFKMTPIKNGQRQEQKQVPPLRYRLTDKNARNDQHEVRDETAIDSGLDS